MSIPLDPNKLIISRNEAAEVLGFSVKVIDRMIANNELETTTIGGRRRIVRRSVLRKREELTRLQTAA